MTRPRMSACTARGSLGSVEMGVGIDGCGSSFVFAAVPALDVHPQDYSKARGRRRAIQDQEGQGMQVPVQDQTQQTLTRSSLEDLGTSSQSLVLPGQRGYEVAKRLLDIGLCLLAIPFALPLLAIIGVLTFMESPGPVFFAQERVGKGGRRFRMYKVRTMYQNLDYSAHKEFMRAFVNGEIVETAAEEAIYKAHESSQVTRLGQIWRRTSLDEVPQLINVLKGEMSLVGPRPNVPWEVEAYQPWHCARLAVLPGITGLAQVRGRSCISFDHLVEQDIQYIKTRGLVTDLKILWWTVQMVISGRGTC